MRIAQGKKYLRLKKEWFPLIGHVYAQKWPKKSRLSHREFPGNLYFDLKFKLHLLNKI